MTRLDTCWKNCLRMWKWLAENLKPGMDVYEMKRVWLRSHGFRRLSLMKNSNCFFCEYHEQHGGGSVKYRGKSRCKHCPGVYVSKAFDCFSVAYHHEDKPNAFYRRLLALDKKRRSG